MISNANPPMQRTEPALVSGAVGTFVRTTIRSLGVRSAVARRPLLPAPLVGLHHGRPE